VGGHPAVSQKLMGDVQHWFLRGRSFDEMYRPPSSDHGAILH
jgi:hypothetical protein